MFRALSSQQAALSRRVPLLPRQPLRPRTTTTGMASEARTALDEMAKDGAFARTPSVWRDTIQAGGRFAPEGAARLDAPEQQPPLAARRPGCTSCARCNATRKHCSHQRSTLSHTPVAITPLSHSDTHAHTSPPPPCPHTRSRALPPVRVPGMPLGLPLRGGPAPQGPDRSSRAQRHAPHLAAHAPGRRRRRALRLGVPLAGRRAGVQPGRPGVLWMPGLRARWHQRRLLCEGPVRAGGRHRRCAVGTASRPTASPPTAPPSGVQCARAACEAAAPAGNPTPP
jgi:hypothetical protein